jgi:glutathione S-transferase
MSKPRLTYFDIPASRGEECRLALHVAGVDFIDNRLTREAWAALKPSTPFGSLPMLELEGQPPLAQSNAILTLIGRRHQLHPEDLLEAARHEALMCHVEDLRAQLGPSLRISEPVEKKRVREELAAGYLPSWGSFTEKQLRGDGPFVSGSKLNVVDLKLYIAVRWFASGGVDHVPQTIFAGFPRLTQVFEAVRDDARIKAWYARR